MFNRKLALALVVILSLVFSGVAMAAVPVEGTPSTPISTTQNITPYTIAGVNPGGNRTCAEVGTAYFGDANYYEFSSDRIDRNNDNTWDQPFPAGVSVTYNTTTKRLDWTSTFSIGAVIVKGGTLSANTYVYEPQKKSDTGLGAAGGAQDVSNVTFCWNPEDEVCYAEETAWADGDRYVTRGNWATYTSYDADDAPFSVTLFAGQTMEAGTVHFSEAVDGYVTITITLYDGWRFYDDPDMENVKIQDYEFAPSGNPSPGGFDHKGYATGSSFSIQVPANNFYGVHVDVEQRVDCPVE